MIRVNGRVGDAEGRVLADSAVGLMEAKSSEARSLSRARVARRRRRASPLDGLRASEKDASMSSTARRADGRREGPPGCKQGHTAQLASHCRNRVIPRAPQHGGSKELGKGLWLAILKQLDIKD